MRRLTLALCAIFGAAGGYAEEPLHVAKNGKDLAVRVVIGGKPGGLELRFESARNARISKFTDVSPLAPRPASKPAVDRETWYPAVDIELEPDMEGVAQFDTAPLTFYSINGMFYREKKPLASEVVISRERLECWENSLFVESGSAHLRSFYLRQRLSVGGGEFRHVYKLLSENWSGRVSLHAVDVGETRELGSGRVADAKSGADEFFGGSGLGRKRLLQSLAATVAYTLRSQNRDSRSPIRGGLYLFYDLDAGIYRTSHWIWGWGPSVKLLLDAARIPEIASPSVAQKMRRAAGEIGQASLRFRVTKKGHPADGVPVSRWDRSNTYDYGHREAITISDANFMSGWAWIPLYEATGDKTYLDAARRLALATDTVSRQFELIPQNYWPDSGSWSDFTLDESGFGTEGLAELFRSTSDPVIREIGRRYIEQHLAKLQREDGLWNQSWFRSKAAASPASHGTRATGWSMEGLLAAHRMMPDGRYLEPAKRMADSLLRGQAPEGYWAYNFARGKDEVGIAQKGTALWSLLFYRLYAATGDPKHLEAARKALAWLLASQYAGPDAEAKGSVYESTPGSAVGYRPWFRVSCTYGSAFFGLAVLEELRLQNGAERAAPAVR